MWDAETWIEHICHIYDYLLTLKIIPCTITFRNILLEAILVWNDHCYQRVIIAVASNSVVQRTVMADSQSVKCWDTILKFVTSPTVHLLCPNCSIVPVFQKSLSLLNRGPIHCVHHCTLCWLVSSVDIKSIIICFWIYYANNISP